MVDGELDYDYLILATGARHSYFGHPEWEKLAPGLKSLEDAVEIRRRILMAFEYAEKISDEAARKAAMTFRDHWWRADWCGNGRSDRRDRALHAGEGFPPHRSIASARHSGRRRTARARVFPEDLPTSAMKQLVDLGVEVRTGSSRDQSYRAGSPGRRRIHSVSRENLGGRQQCVVCRQVARRAGRSRRSGDR